MSERKAEQSISRSKCRTREIQPSSRRLTSTVCSARWRVAASFLPLPPREWAKRRATTFWSTPLRLGKPRPRCRFCLPGHKTTRWAGMQPLREALVAQGVRCHQGGGARRPAAAGQEPRGDCGPHAQLQGKRRCAPSATRKRTRTSCVRASRNSRLSFGSVKSASPRPTLSLPAFARRMACSRGSWSAP